MKKTKVSLSEHAIVRVGERLKMTSRPQIIDTVNKAWFHGHRPSYFGEDSPITVYAKNKIYSPVFTYRVYCNTIFVFSSHGRLITVIPIPDWVLDAS